ncbi:MAG: hypothetical protein IPH03_10855 [Tetrasphaera sp.]|nr:hypothetical protein [Tetrasphaera sp.]
MESQGWLPPQRWVDLAVVLLLSGFEDAEVAELAGLPADISGWVTEPLVQGLYDRYAVTPVVSVDSAVETIAALLAADLRARPANVTAPMIRLLAKLAPPEFSSPLANQCFGAEEYLDCECVAEVDSSWEVELEARPGPAIPDELVMALAAELRSTLPAQQPPHSH